MLHCSRQHSCPCESTTDKILLLKITYAVVTHGTFISAPKYSICHNMKTSFFRHIVVMQHLLLELQTALKQHKTRLLSADWKSL